ncbi:MAG TPA: carbohydrate ABC transporter permease [Chloroflexaceae bacterium]|nr:carbohydrate ABC transporter permease [Chloroflexaceae bacterium]
MSSMARPSERVQGRQAGASLLSRVLLYALLILISLFFVLPLVWMFSTALKPFAEWVQPNWIPRNPTLQNFSSIFADPSLPALRWFFNSLGIAVAFTALVVIIDSLAAYAYARMSFPGRNVLFGLLLATLVMPGIMFLVPNYLTVNRLGWLDTYQGVIAPGLSGVFGVFFLRQFFLGIPRELEEAAIIDGAGTWTTFLRVVLPLSQGALATLAVITFLESWNNFLWPLLILNDRPMQTLPVGLATLQGQYTFDYGKLMAGAAVTAVPVLILYALLQRYIVQSVAMTGLKG